MRGDTSQSTGCGHLREPSDDGDRTAVDIATELMKLLDLVELYLTRHGEDCPCPFCSRSSTSGYRPGVALAEVLGGSVAILTLLAGAVEGHLPAADNPMTVGSVTTLSTS